MPKVDFVLTERKLIGSLPDDRRQTVVCRGPSSGGRVERRDHQPCLLYTSSAVPGAAGLRDLHLRIDGPAKGGGDHPRRPAYVIQSIGKDVALKPADVVLANATIAFDISNEEIFLPLVAGASVHLLEPEFVGDGGKLIEVMRRSKPAWSSGPRPPGGWLLEAGWQGDQKSANHRWRRGASAVAWPRPWRE